MRRSVLAPIRVLLASTSPRTRSWLVVIGLVGVLVRLSVLVTARKISLGALREAALVSVIVGVAVALQRIAQSRVRVGVECDLHRSAIRALVESDVLEPPVADLQRAVLEGDWRARGIVATTIPQLASDVLVCFVVVPYLACVVPSRVLGIGVAALVAVIAFVVALRQVTQRSNEQLLNVSQDIYDNLLMGIDGRLEIAARAGEEELKAKVEQSLLRYSRVATRAGLRSAMAGRAPLAVGAAIVGVAAFFDPATRQAIDAAVLGDALLLAACLPPIMGAALGAHEVVRSSTLLSPLIRVLTAPPRLDLSAGGASPPDAPFGVDVAALSFRYGKDGPMTLTDISIRWDSGAALLVEGPNGSGKSTFLRLLLGLRPPTSGAIRIGGIDLSALDRVAFRRCASYLPQGPYLGEPQTCVDAAMRMAVPLADETALRTVLARVGVLEALERRTDPLKAPVGTLSAGQRQRVALARVLVEDASLVLLDEPDAYLDSAGVALVAQIINELVAAGKMVAVAAHSPELAVNGAVKLTLTRLAG